ncbi:hypothetical protein B0J13DRAFT_588996 [Dactylonectria estremocensis]|uniref:Linalool dehydratase/isomerase domain-containing protein n=1 Tax=Dactylonectria estremocensis TaxID=1079267 RepID=A0A9P9ILK0_9HYPO|nr:hypothetical protein B0J13DRAFT_588996 [Dactylonectria estremocensis]
MPTVHSLRGSKLPQKIDRSFSRSLPKLNREQAGHLRHFYNLVATPDGEWTHMGSAEPGQEWLSSYRYQLATMTYAAGLAHYHRLPALRSVFKQLIEKLIYKMLLREVWDYWYLTSQSGSFLDPDLKELRKPWADPVVKENIMYSGHLLLMVSLHAMLFNDDKYDQEAALTFTFDPIAWGFGPEKFVYNRSSLQEVIIKQMEESNWLGVCCEPNCVFVVCNQFPLMAIRLNDVRNGTNIVEDVCTKYMEAWDRKGMLQEDGLMVNWYAVKQDKTVPADGIGLTAWASAYMNAWNPKISGIESLRARSVGYLSRREDGRINLNRTAVATAILELVKEGADPDDPETVQKAREIASSVPPPPFEPSFFMGDGTYGHMVKWAAEVGAQDILDGLLKHSDELMNPSWENGGFFYPRSDKRSDEDGNWTEVDPITGNASIGHGRLNVPNGLQKMWREPWTQERVANYPCLDNVDLGSNIDFLQGAWNEELGALIVTMRAWNGHVSSITTRCHNLVPGEYGIYINGTLSHTQTVAEKGGSIILDISVGAEEQELVILAAR